MKTLHIFALALTLTFSPVISAANETAGYTDSIAAKIQSTIRLPESNVADENQRVFVVFSIAEDGSVMVNEVGTYDAQLKASLIAQFESMRFDNTESTYDGMYSIWLNFKTL